MPDDSDLTVDCDPDEEPWVKRICPILDKVMDEKTLSVAELEDVHRLRDVMRAVVESKR